MLNAKGAAVGEERSSKRAPMTDAEARRLLASVRRIVVARGRQRRELAARDATLDDLRGPSGGFRAPLLRVGDTLIVGFDAQSLAELL